MPNQVISIDEENAESINKTRMEINKELKELTPGKAVLGYVGVRKKAVEPQPEKLTAEDKETRKKIQALLIKYVEPPILSENKPNPAKDKVSFLKKVDRQTLGELRRFWGKKAIPEELSDDEIAELNRKWADISP